VFEILKPTFFFLEILNNNRRYGLELDFHHRFFYKKNSLELYRLIDLSFEYFYFLVTHFFHKLVRGRFYKQSFQGH
jgi:hypothetical protein